MLLLSKWIIHTDGWRDLNKKERQGEKYQVPGEFTDLCDSKLQYNNNVSESQMLKIKQPDLWSLENFQSNF